MQTQCNQGTKFPHFQIEQLPYIYDIYDIYMISISIPLHIPGKLLELLYNINTVEQS